MLAHGGLGHQRHAACGHHTQGPGRHQTGSLPCPRDAMGDGDPGAFLLKNEIDLLLKAGAFLGDGRKPHTEGAKTLPGDRRVVRIVAKFLRFRSQPQPVASPVAPLGFSHPTRLVIVDVERIRAAKTRVGEDAGTDIQRDQQLDRAVGHLQDVRPSLEGHRLDC